MKEEKEGARVAEAGQERRILVQKFGGTSVATPEAREQVRRHILQAKADGYDVVVVVSAMGRKGEPYATDTLLALARQVELAASPRELDLLLACGEIISSVILAQSLISAGHPAVALTGAQAGIITDEVFGQARILRIETGKILAHLRLGKIVVVAGFQGVSENGEVTTLGRGGSDITATALGVALQAEAAEIYTDVEGIYTADPRLVPDAQALRILTYSEVCELAHLGAKVIHPRAVEIAMAGRLPVKIKSTFTEGAGTLITDSWERRGRELSGGGVVTGLAHVGKMAQVKLRTEGDFNASGLGLAIFQALARARISVDMINVSPEMISFIIEEGAAPAAAEVLRAFPGIQVEVKKGFAKVSAVGAAMRGVPGVMAAVVEALHGAGVPILQTTDSHTNISCLVPQADLVRAMRALHAQFLGEGTEKAREEAPETRPG